MLSSPLASVRLERRWIALINVCCDCVTRSLSGSPCSKHNRWRLYHLGYSGNLMPSVFHSSFFVTGNVDRLPLLLPCEQHAFEMGVLLLFPPMCQHQCLWMEFPFTTVFVLTTRVALLTFAKFCAAFSKASAREHSPTEQYLWRHFLLFSRRTFAGARFAERSTGWPYNRSFGRRSTFLRAFYMSKPP